MRLVLDTDVVVAALRSPRGASAGLLETALNGRVQLPANVALILEYEAVCTRHEHLEAAQHRSGRDRLQKLRDADEALDRVRVYLRLAVGWHWLNDGQYEHVAAMVAEIGRLLGGWQRVTRPAER